MQNQIPRGSGQPRRDRNQLGADGRGGGLRMEDRGQGAGGAGEVEGHRSADQPGAVGPELPRRQVGHGSALEVGDDLFDDRVAACWASARNIVIGDR